MTKRRIPCRRNCRTNKLRKGSFPTTASAFGVDATTDRKRVPKPPTSSTAFVLPSITKDSTAGCLLGIGHAMAESWPGVVAHWLGFTPSTYGAEVLVSQ